MKNPATLDAFFQEAVAALDAGEMAALERLLSTCPQLLSERLTSPGAWLRDKVGDALLGFFQQPYLLWFIAEDPVRNNRLPKNIAQVARTIIAAAQSRKIDSLQAQLDYALRLVCWSWVARKCEVQIDLIDVLLNAGASPANTIAHDALVNGNFAAAAHLVRRGALLTLPTALCLERWDEVTRLAPPASAGEKQFAFILAALHGKTEAIRRILGWAVDVNRPSAELYSHATALHHAVCSGSLDTVKVLVEAGASLDTKDLAWHGTPLDWAEYYTREAQEDHAGKQYREITAYLRDIKASHFKEV